MNWGDGKDTTDKSIIWIDGETKGKNSSGEDVSAPTQEDIEDTLRGQLMELLQDGGLELLKTLLPDQLFVEDVKQDQSDIDTESDGDEPLPDEEPDEEDFSFS